MVHFVDPVQDLGAALLSVEKPNRYVGGEYGRLARRDATLQTLIAFPDLYEIGMSNQALKILYNQLNAIDGASCDRAFAPAPDFERLLRERRLPLYGLDTGISLRDRDLLFFTFGYELGITNVLAMLDLAAIPLHNSERGDSDPIVLMGGPCVSNPLPYQDFVDAFWIGEAEGGFFEMFTALVAMKIQGASRGELLAYIIDHPSVWTRGKTSARRAIDTMFTKRVNDVAVFPIPNMRVIQHHGAVEIMRGCPNGCRFCHAGYWYRPMRQKSIDAIEREVAAFVRRGGYREICLSSLSSGDYRGIEALVDRLNSKFRQEHVSFQLPSLRVSTFSLPLLAKLAEVRKSGLTFAVETPIDAWQLAINKQVSLDNVTAILKEARKQGWRGAKFYFMVGLPLPNIDEITEEAAIIGFILELAKRAGMHFSVNVGTFIPKPHTPYQWAAQIDEAAARVKLEYIRYELKSRGHKVGIQDPFISTLEGIISRGDERAGALIETAYRRGCRLDAWNEYIQKNVWYSIFAEHEVLTRDFLSERPSDAPLPWNVIDSGILPDFMQEERKKSFVQGSTSQCIEKCTHFCGTCTYDTHTVENIIQHDISLVDVLPSTIPNLPSSPVTHRLLFIFTKTGSAIFQPHLALIELFSMSMTRAAVPVFYTQGFNPLPKLEIAAPLSIGVSASAEIAAIETFGFYDAARFLEVMNCALPEGIRIVEAINVNIPFGVKKYSLSSLLWGFAYANGAETDYVPAANDKQYRAARIDATGSASVYGLHRLAVLAKSAVSTDAPESYFTVYRALYPDVLIPRIQNQNSPV
ncbi:MAG: TIGR03936 family radical SAM-associated protein [Treponema sp.]|jgi:radical SAM superfamily enzyme YgiQ (UPF0313 family)|nr:TIGR03936 family radical SAM-associated protein [Treponema sp.]